MRSKYKLCAYNIISGQEYTIKFDSDNEKGEYSLLEIDKMTASFENIDELSKELIYFGQLPSGKYRFNIEKSKIPGTNYDILFNHPYLLKEIIKAFEESNKHPNIKNAYYIENSAEFKKFLEWFWKKLEISDFKENLKTTKYIAPYFQKQLYRLSRNFIDKSLKSKLASYKVIRGIILSNIEYQNAIIDKMKWGYFNNELYDSEYQNGGSEEIFNNHTLDELKRNMSDEDFNAVLTKKV